MSDRLFDDTEFDARKAWQREPYPLYDGTPPHEDVDTSVEAARRIEPVTGKLRRRIWDALTVPSTDDDLEVLLDLPHQTVSARRRELALLGMIEHVGYRKTRSGRRAKVWKAIEPGGSP